MLCTVLNCLLCTLLIGFSISGQSAQKHKGCLPSLPAEPVLALMSLWLLTCLRIRLSL